VPIVDAPFNINAWHQALQKFGAVTRLTVTVYAEDGHVVLRGVPSTPLFALFDEHGYVPDIFAECARQCLAQGERRPAVIVAPSYSLAVVGTSLLLEGRIVGAAVAGYALVDFLRAPLIEGLARASGIAFRRLWSVALQQQPLSQGKLLMHGELLQVLGDTILKENYRTRQFEETAARLAKEMSAKDEFLAVLSHELRTPLTPMLTWLEILRRRNVEPAKRQQAMESIERNARLQVRLIDDLLDLNRILREKVPLDLRTHELTNIVQLALDTVAESASRKNIAIEVASDASPVYVEADATRLQQVFGNILSNAVKFTPEGGQVKVDVERVQDEATVRISDTGAGVAADFLPHVFDMFRQQEEGTRRAHSGLGIGLALVKRLVELQHGSVEIASGGPGCGTQVTVRLPTQMKPPDVAVDVSTLMNETRALERITILLVEDTQDTREPMRLLLEQLGARVLEAANGSQALDVLAVHHPDVVLCDLSMPVMDGFEFVRALTRGSGDDHPPVVAISGLASKADREKTSAAGFRGHLGKPFDIDVLVATVKTTVDQRKSA
jgi:signal transduction histidine kinase/ActR/RegA family two-component response regulator